MSNSLVLKNARTTFQRLSDAKFFHGWVNQISPQTVSVYSCSDTRFECGDQFSFQVFGAGMDAHFQATLVNIQNADLGKLFSNKRSGCYPAELSSHISGPITFRDSREQPRFFVRDIGARFSDSTSELCPVLDIGPLGLSVVTDREFRKGDEISLSIHSPIHTLNCIATVRNIIAYDFQRVGFEIVTMDRIDAKKWARIYASVLESNKVPGIMGQDPDLNRAPNRAA